MTDETDPTKPDGPYADKARLCGLLDRVRGREHLRTKDRDWWVEGIRMPCRPFVVGGAEKCLKTNIAVDLAVALASGKPFLGRFKVRRPARVLYFSAESGEDDIESMVRRMRAARKLEPFPPPDDDPLAFNFNAVPLGDEGVGGMLQEAIRQHRADVLVIDPMYLSLGLGGTRELRPESLFDVGLRLQRAMTACRQTGCTPVFVHHGKNIKLGQIPKLADLQYAGFRQYAGQWLLLNRQAAYADDGKHRLVMIAGGRDGHSSRWSVEVDEGKKGHVLSRWGVRVQPRGQAKAAAPSQKATGASGPAPTGSPEKAREDALKVREAVLALRGEKKGSKVRRKAAMERAGIKSGPAMTAAVEYACSRKWMMTEGMRPKYLIPL